MTLGGPVIHGTPIAAYKVSKDVLMKSSVVLEQLINAGGRVTSCVLDTPF
jgi:hypothetical protein